MEGAYQREGQEPYERSQLVYKTHIWARLMGQCNIATISWIDPSHGNSVLARCMIAQ
jgi:hypothetical protein